MIVEGRIVEFILLILIIAAFLYIVNKTRNKRYSPSLRRIPAVDAIDEAIGRAVEMGRGIHFSTGAGTQLSGVNAPMTLAGISVASYVAKAAARVNIPFMYTTNVPDMVPLMQDVIGQSYAAEGKVDSFDPTRQVRYIANDQTIYAIHVAGVMEREKTGANFYMGPTRGETPIVLERAHNIGAMNITGTGRWVLIPVHAVMADYFLIMEELFAAGAYLSKDPEMIATVVTQDLPKIIVIILLLLGVIAVLAGNNSILWLLGL